MNRIAKLYVVFLGVSLVLFQTHLWAKPLALSEAYQTLFQSTGPDHLWLAPNRQWLAMAQGNRYPTVEQLDPEYLFHAVGKSFSLKAPLEKVTAEFEVLQLLHVETGRVTSLQLPKASILSVSWSPDSTQMALLVRQQEQVKLWRYTVNSAELTPWSERVISAQFSSDSVVWLPDSRSVIIRHSVSQPRSQSGNHTSALSLKASAEEIQDRVYRDALDSADRRELFYRLTLQQAVLINHDGKSRELSEPAMLEKMQISPDGRYVLLQFLDEALHATLKFSRLARRYQVVEITSAKPVATPPSLAAAVLQARQPDSAAEGARLVQWLSGEAAALTWVEARETQGSKVNALARDQVKIWKAPFVSAAAPLFSSDWRIFQLFWTEQGLAVYSDFQSQEKQLRLWRYSVNEPGQPARLLQQYHYSHAESWQPEIERLANGSERAISDPQGRVYLRQESRIAAGSANVKAYGASASQDLWVFQSADNSHQSPLYLRAQAESLWMLVVSQTATKAPVLELWSAGQFMSQIYDWHKPHLPVLPTPQLIRFSREDSVPMQAKLYLPAQNRQQKLPVLIWLYPKEYSSKEAISIAAQSAGFSLIDPAGPMVALLEGIAVVDASDAPILKPASGYANDTYLQQQLMNTDALVQALAETGQIDTQNMILMGHSYGAFSALSLLAHTQLFKGAIARSGAYNRSLTPLGFQGEKRTLWQAPEVYLQLSPFYQADKITAPVLLIHGTADQNAGTDVLQSEMMLQGLRANGVESELLLLAGEGHQYQMKENIQLLLETQLRWLQKQLGRP